MPDIDQLSINTIRVLSIDMVQNANSGHPGLPMGAAPMAYVLWTRFLEHNPRDPKWPDRDRFVLSAGHGSALLYSLLHLTGYDLSMDQLKLFRQAGSQTPGHPEYGLAPGIETTTGPLGQGFANGVGMGIAERHLAARFNRPGHEIVDHYTYVLCSDGDLEEGVSYEAASLAGHLKLGKLIYIYDDNHISIEGDTALAFTENVDQRFEAAGWHVQAVDGLDLEAVDRAIRAAQAETGRPSIIRARTQIAYGSPNKQGSAGAHGNPLGVEEVKLTKQNLGFPPDESFYLPAEALAHFREAVEQGRAREEEWQRRFEAYRGEYPELAAQVEAEQRGELPSDWDADLPRFGPADGQVATRTSAGKALNALASRVPNLIGGSADLAPSTDTTLAGLGDFSADNYAGRTMHFGIREHAMGSIVNGMTVHGGLHAFGATFLIFSDYCRPAVRLSALMEVPSIFVFTHDSVGLGEDGPTHQPIEHLTALRAIPHLLVMRPADANESAAVWKVTLEQRHRPVAMALTRQKLPILDLPLQDAVEGVRRGGYILREAANGSPDVVLIATGSEVHLALGAQARLAESGVQARVVSMPCTALFDEQPEAYRRQVIPAESVHCLAIEAGVTHGWWRYVGFNGDVFGLDRYGLSGPYDQVMKALGFTVENVVKHALALLQQQHEAQAHVPGDGTLVGSGAAPEEGHS